MKAQMNSKQQGIALLVSLVFLLVLTIIGVSSMRSTTLEERMTSNQKDYYLAFESAEFALSQAETVILTMDSTATFNQSGVNGLFRDHDKGAKVWESVDWDDPTEVIYITTHPNMTAEDPKYIVEEIATVLPGDESEAVNVGMGYGEQSGDVEITIFRVTARGKSGRGSTVYLQATVGRAF